ncbi:HAD family hydrolase [Neptuniibacter sp. QD34_54]|uniref:HAD family hydrolase n=1 Tax=Neptuniibacter sp. QD34_54 TaxID=3398208 RepID=UPI0039F4F6A4
MPLNKSNSLRVAFFDMDETILNFKSMFSFQSYFYDHAKKTGLFSSKHEFLEHLESRKSSLTREQLNREFYRSFAGRDLIEVKQLAESWFIDTLEKMGDNFWIQPTIDLINQLKSDGYQIVAVSGSSREILAPISRYLSLNDCLSTHTCSDSGVLNGEIESSLIGNGKVLAILNYAEETNLNLESCMACGDHISDVHMLEIVGLAKIVAGDPELETFAKRKGWEIIQPQQKSPDHQLSHV